MRRSVSSFAFIALCAAAVTAATAVPASAATSKGPSTTVAPYVLPVADGVSIKSLLTVNDKTTDNGYRMAGIPDGIGVKRDGADIVAYVNHELRATAGIVRRHGEKGAFVSRLVIDPVTGRVKHGSDLIDPGTRYWDYPAGAYAAAPVPPADFDPAADPSNPDVHKKVFSRFCSSALTAPGQLHNSRTKAGYTGQLYFGNEETGNEGRSFGITTDGLATQLPRLGLFSWENTKVAGNTTNTTVVMGNEDATPGELWTYVGAKRTTGSAVAKAGLTNGRNHVVKVAGVTTDLAFRAAHPTGTAVPFTLNDVEWNQSGKAQNAEALAEGGLGFSRVEDGDFDPDNRNDYYFVTTEGGDKTPTPDGVTRDGGGLWKLSFTDVNKPKLGGTLTLLLDGTESWGTQEDKINKPDNMTIDRAGNLLIQEDPGGNDQVARILSYRIADGARGVVARFDPALFGATIPTGTTPDTRAVFTTDEESSGIVQLPGGAYLFDAQVHSAKNLPAGTGPGTVEELVENGQLLRMWVSDFSKVYTELANPTGRATQPA